MAKILLPDNLYGLWQDEAAWRLPAMFHLSRPCTGSAQICITHRGKTLIAAGDYKRKYDPTVIPFEMRSCDVFITEATFGLPVFMHPDPLDEIAKLQKSERYFPIEAVSSAPILLARHNVSSACYANLAIMTPSICTARFSLYAIITKAKV